MRGARLPLEHELVPFQAGFPPGTRWLVLAPHPDDETFGAGATLALAVRRGVTVRLIVVTDGGAQGEAAPREAEARAAAAVLGITEPVFWRLADRSLEPGDRRLQRAIAAACAEFSPEALFVTSPVDLHPDHRALALAAQRALRRRTLLGVRTVPPAWIVTYDVGTLQQPNLLVAADGGWALKRRAAACYASQTAVRPYERAMEAFGDVRSLTLTGVEKAEGFRVASAGRVARLSARVWASRCGSPAGVERRAPTT